MSYSSSSLSLSLSHRSWSFWKKSLTLVGAAGRYGGYTILGLRIMADMRLRERIFFQRLTKHWLTRLEWNEEEEKEEEEEEAMKETVTGRCSRQKSMETRSSQLVWKPTTTQEAQASRWFNNLPKIILLLSIASSLQQSFFYRDNVSTIMLLLLSLVMFAFTVEKGSSRLSSMITKKKLLTAPLRGVCKLEIFY